MTKTGRQAPRKRKPRVSNIETWAQLLQFTNIRTWDLVLIGDGSGVGWDKGAGWGGVLVERFSRARKWQAGALSAGTSQLGELLPFLFLLDWYVSSDGPGRQRQKEMIRDGRRLQTYILTDSAATVRAGNYPGSRRSHVELWAALDAFQARGFDLHFRHIPRDKVNLHILLDQLARRTRLEIEDVYAQTLIDLQQDYPDLPSDLSIYDLNP